MYVPVTVFMYFAETSKKHYDDPRGLSDAVVAIQKLLEVIRNSKGARLEIALFL